MNQTVDSCKIQYTKVPLNAPNFTHVIHGALQTDRAM